MAKNLTILGSTGSIGVNALKVVDNLGSALQVVGLSAHTNGELIISQARAYRPQRVAVSDPATARTVEKALAGSGIEVLAGPAGLVELAADEAADICLNGLVGAAGMEPTVAAVKAGIDVALSNKESLVMAGDLITGIQRRSGSRIFPVDSEHSAIWQCLTGEDQADIRRLILTGSGGPFRTRARETFGAITATEALNHPNWSMGRKITIDSATMMNKGLEVIEARWLFDLPAEQIAIVIHPQSIIHSLVEFTDGSVKAQLGLPDMKLPIQYALTYPRHAPARWEELNLVRIGELTFSDPDLEKFPCIGLAYAALKTGGTAPAVLNVANEEAVYRFLDGEIRFVDIPNLISAALEHHHQQDADELETIRQAGAWAREFARKWRPSGTPG